MTGDLREAFHRAVVHYLNWTLRNEEQMSWGFHNMQGERFYDPEPTVEFFGQQYTISNICERAGVLTGSLPEHLRLLFISLDRHSGEPLPETYPEAVEALNDLIECEIDQLERTPLTEPPTAHRLWESGFREGVGKGAECAAAALELALNKVLGRPAA